MKTRTELLTTALIKIYRTNLGAMTQSEMAMSIANAPDTARRLLRRKAFRNLTAKDIIEQLIK